MPLTFSYYLNSITHENLFKNDDDVMNGSRAKIIPQKDYDQFSSALKNQLISIQQAKKDQ